MSRLLSVLLLSSVLAAAVAFNACGDDSGSTGTDLADSSPDADVTTGPGDAVADEDSGPGGSHTGGGAADGSDDTQLATDGAADTASPDDGQVSEDTGGDADLGCEPVCDLAWECGSDGCGGTCGAGCSADQVCGDDTHLCEAVLGASFGAACGRTDDCMPTVSTAGGSVDNPEWPACLHAQCASGVCLEPVCSKKCVLTKDEIDSAGNPSPDGIEDADSESDACADAEDGPQGSAFTCVTESAPDGDGAQGDSAVSVCKPGWLFGPCGSDADCSTDETCQLGLFWGQYVTRCAAAIKGGGAVGEACNESPETAEVALCASNQCFGEGCSAVCGSDADCLTDVCDGGLCAKTLQSCSVDQDCSAFHCMSLPLTSEAGSSVFDFCVGRSCDTNVDCAGEYFCALATNGEADDGLAWAHACSAPAPDAATLGEECEENPSDNIPKPPCAGPCLDSGVCSAICTSDADCSDAALSMLCRAQTVGFDLDQDGADDSWLPLGLCSDEEGSQAPCVTSDDCDFLEACTLFTYFSDEAETTMDGRGICTVYADTEGDIGDMCGGPTGSSCKSGFCLSSSATQPGYCTQLCGSVDDCPQSTTLGLFAGTYNMACRAQRYADGVDASMPEDFVYAPLCTAVSAESSSLEQCGVTTPCVYENEACFPFPIAVGSTGPTKVELLCASNQGVDPQGGAWPATAEVGDPCDLTGDYPEEGVCKTGLCVPGEDPEVGYCSALCATDADCTAPGHVCAPKVLIDRAGDDNDLTVDLCTAQ